MVAPSMIACDSVGKRFGERRVLSAASTHVRAGEVRAILGRNGVGKSTLLRILVGLVTPDYGRVEWRGFNADGLSFAARCAQGLRYLPSEGLLSPYDRLREQLLDVAERFGGDVNLALELLDLGRVARQRIGALSGGEQRRANLAVALLGNPTAFVADEPFRDVDPKDRAVVGHTLQELARRGTACVITGHELPTIMSFATHITLCTSGTCYDLGTVAHATEQSILRREVGWLG
ncbi:MAG: ABC transporter ATP-binding protein [Gemmatimonadaceae bacterium]|nr:ABC transporter ATP-binding protein [Gemmatimonadaceae bacterium]